MIRRMTAMVLGLVLLFPTSAMADVLNYEAVSNTYKQDNKIPGCFTVNDGAGTEVQVIEKRDTLYATAKEVILYSLPGITGKKKGKVLLGDKLERVAVCDNGWSKVYYETKKGRRKIGYVPDNYLSDRTELVVLQEEVTVKKDSDILDFPGKKDGQIIGEILQEDKITVTGTFNDVWSRIEFLDENQESQVGYVPLKVVRTNDEAVLSTETETKEEGEIVEAGVIHESSGEGIFAQAVDEVSGIGDGTVVNGVQIGNPVAVSSDTALKSLGTFRITHYCQCSICCGPWANGITSTGVTATTNRTIAVDPTQIPYGSQVVINGQVYVAEDCGGAITTNCIDIYVATHDEGESKGVYYTEVYLIQ